MLSLEPKHTLFNSQQEMLSTETLSGLLNRPVPQVICRPFEKNNGWSGSLLYHVEAGGQKLVLKRLRPTVDWQANISHDRRCRSVRVWQYGLLDRLTPHMQHSILAACQDGEDYAILMRDVSPGLLNGQHTSPATVRRMLDALARMHAAFWEDKTLLDENLGLSNLDGWFFLIRPLQPEHYQHAPHVLDILQKGREALLERVEPDVRAVIQSLLDDSRPLEAFMHRLPRTLVRGDFGRHNMAFFPETQELVVYDWQQATFGPVNLDVCYFMGSLVDHLDMHEAYYRYYYQQLVACLGERIDPALWQPMIDVGCLINVMNQGVFHAYFATYIEDDPFRTDMQRSVNSYNDLVRRGAAWL